MRWLYTLALYLLAPLLLLRLLWRGFALPAYWRRIPERFGFVPAAPDGVAVWVHAVSVGEAAAAMPLLKHLVARHPPGTIWVTTTTPTGSDRVRAALGDSVRHTYVPYDLPGAVRRFLRRAQPRRLVVMETELWPNLFRALARAGVPFAVANARLSARSHAGYRRLGRLARATLADCALIAAQSEADAQRYRALGADPSRVYVTGNLKFDVEVPAAQLEAGRALRGRLGATRPVWVAASTHEGEEADALAAHHALLVRRPDAVLILVPRHPQRFAAVGTLIDRSGLRAVRRPALDAGSPSPLARAQVVFGNSMGELALYLGAADVAFVGGSLVPVGGHNVLEPAAAGLPVLFGPHMGNFEAARALLLERGAALTVANGDALAHELAALLADPARRAHMGAAGREAVRANRGALRRLLALLERLPSK
jgi:3-deoxy-D-manno-octulosonic-acid transferase